MVQSERSMSTKIERWMQAFEVSDSPKTEGLVRIDRLGEKKLRETKFSKASTLVGNWR